MNRKAFLKLCGVFGLSLPFENVLSSCKKTDKLSKAYGGKVVIIGAGAGGLSAAYFLKQQGTEFKILEASSHFGGRMKISRDFADFPIPLGAEWLETKTSIFREIINDDAVSVNVATFSDEPDQKFVNYSWFNFFEEYIVPSIEDQIHYQNVVQSIDYSNDQIVINTSKGQYLADKVILSVPLKILQNGLIKFTPELPQNKRDIIHELEVWDGFKAFFEFKNKFYGDEEYEFTISLPSDGQKLYYNASLGQKTNSNILGLFTVGKPALPFISRSGDELKYFILNELDTIYSDKATPNYLGHVTQNWSEEPFIKGGYLSDYADWKKVRELSTPIEQKIFFAGGEYTDGEDWVSVHTAALSAKKAINELNLLAK